MMGGGPRMTPGKCVLGGGEEALVTLRVALGVKQAGLVTQNVVDQSPHKTGRS